MIVGRFFALLQLAWFPIVILCCLLQLLGWLLPLLGAPIGDTVEINSLLVFAIMMSIPSFCFIIALVFLITLLVKNRVVSVLASMSVIGALAAALYKLPVIYYPFVDLLGITITAPFPTDMITSFATTEGWFQRSGVLVISLALLGFAAAIHPRLDDSNRARTTLFSGVILATGGVLLIVSSVIFTANLGNQQWLNAHAAVESTVLPDILQMNAAVTVDPGKSMQVNLQLVFQAPAQNSINSALFTLNPGFANVVITDSRGQNLANSFENGLLNIALPATLASGQSMQINLEYSGTPDNQFAYLDSKLKYESLKDFNDRGLQGTEPGMFDKQFVALMPGTYWLPLAGNDIERDDTRSLPRDFFGLTLDVEVPADWLVAGPGKREVLPAVASGNTRFRFAPEPLLSEVALISAKYQQFTADINNIHFEMLLYPDHTQNFTVLTSLRGEIEQWVSNRLTLAEDAGLVYPFDAFTLVEVPNGLRVYKGGWRMDTALAPPAMMLMNESGFPTSRFDFSINRSVTSSASGSLQQGSIGFNQESFKNISFDRLLTFFSSDLSGGNIFMGMSRSYFSHHTAATGEEAIALNFILDMLATLVVSDQRYYFSMYNNINATVTNLINTVAGGNGAAASADTTLTQRTIESFSNNIEVWNSGINSSLARIDTSKEPAQTINLLTLKGGELAQAIYDVLGAQRAGEFLAGILQNYRNTPYILADVVSTLATFDEDLSVLFEESFNTTQLPGFVADNARLFRLPDGSNGEQRYQLLVALRNDEPVAGFTRFAWMIQGEEQRFYNSIPVRVDGNSAIEFGVVLSQPPINALVKPYLALNRGQFVAGLFTDQQAIPRENAEPFDGVRDIPWNPTTERIISDDLDLNFYIIDDSGQSTPDRVAAAGEVTMDQGIRVNRNNAPDNWNRIPSTSSFGKYRHTFLSVLAGDGNKKAVFASDIPNAGLWDLEIHIPYADGQRQDNMRGIWNMEIITANGREKIAFDNRAAIAGWNLIGSFDIPAGPVQIEVTNNTDAIVVVVDAFAWTPISTNNGAAQ